MGKSQRAKGQRGERDLVNKLGELLGMPLARNLSQTRGGGADCLDLPGWAIEVKYHKTLSIPEWWRQAIAQGQAAKCKPMLCYRETGKRQWWAKVFINDLLPGRGHEGDTMTLNLEALARLLLRYYCRDCGHEYPMRVDVCQQCGSALISECTEGSFDG